MPATSGSARRPRAYGAHSTEPERERAYLVGLEHRTAAQHGDGVAGAPQMAAAESLRELGRLAETAGASVVGQALQRRAHPDPATFVGSGKCAQCHQEQTDMFHDATHARLIAGARPPPVPCRTLRVPWAAGQAAGARSRKLRQRRSGTRPRAMNASCEATNASSA